MGRERRPRLEVLETRELLTSAHPSPLPRMPISLDGTLTVEVQKSVQSQNADGGWTTSVPVSGHLGTTGAVSGSWRTSITPFGGYLGPDTLELKAKNPKGSLEIAFNNLNLGQPHKVSIGEGFYQHGQHLAAGTGSFARAEETGSIELMIDGKQGSATRIVLISVPPTGPAKA